GWPLHLGDPGPRLPGRVRPGLTQRRPALVHPVRPRPASDAERRSERGTCLELARAERATLPTLVAGAAQALPLEIRLSGPARRLQRSADGADAARRSLRLQRGASAAQLPQVRPALSGVLARLALELAGGSAAPRASDAPAGLDLLAVRCAALRYREPGSGRRGRGCLVRGLRGRARAAPRGPERRAAGGGRGRLHRRDAGSRRAEPAGARRARRPGVCPIL